MGRDFEAEHMAVAGDVVHRDKQVSRFLAVVSLVTFVAMVTSALTLGQQPGAAWTVAYLPWPVAALSLFVGLFRTVVRTVVTTEEVRVMWGLWGPRIPLDAIRRCEVERGPFKGRHERYSTDGNEAVVLEWQDGETLRKAVVGSHTPGLLKDAIDRARAKKKARIADVGAEEAEAEAEALAGEDAATAARREA